MKNIYEHKDELYEVYFNHFFNYDDEISITQQKKLKKEFHNLMKLSYLYMPYWFVSYLQLNEYEYRNGAFTEEN